MDNFKLDSEYGYKVDLMPERDIQTGHTGFGFTKEDTEVIALQKILDRYIDTSTLDKSIEFVEHKLDFSVVFLDSMILILTDKRAIMQAYFDEVDRQLEAVNHRMIKPHVEGRVLTKDEKLEIYDLQTKLLVERRGLKDSIAILKVNIENLEKSRNFILGMNQRKYTPKTDRFKDDEDYQLGKYPRERIEEDATRIKVAPDATE